MPIGCGASRGRTRGGYRESGGVRGPDRPAGGRGRRAGRTRGPSRGGAVNADGRVAGRSAGSRRGVSPGRDAGTCLAAGRATRTARRPARAAHPPPAHRGSGDRRGSCGSPAAAASGCPTSRVGAGPDASGRTARSRAAPSRCWAARRSARRAHRSAVRGPCRRSPSGRPCPDSGRRGACLVPNSAQPVRARRDRPPAGTSAR